MSTLLYNVRRESYSLRTKKEGQKEEMKEKKIIAERNYK
jgi:hypothetical protein